MNNLIILVKLYFKSLSTRNCTFATYSTKNDKLYLFREGRYFIGDVDFLIYASNQKDCDKFSIFLLKCILEQINLILEND